MFVVVFGICSFMQAQNYLISFTGSGASTTIDSVKAENLTQNTSLTINGSDILNLLGSTGLNNKHQQTNELLVYPNPMTESCFLQFYSEAQGTAVVEINSLSGSSVLQRNINVNKGLYSIKLSGIPSGVYWARISTGHASYMSQFISLNTKQGTPSISVGGDFSVKAKSTATSGKSTVPMAYNDGEVMMFTSFSGTYTTVTTLIPAASQTINSVFSSCTDASGNNYAVVTIGTQTWMAENLRTNKYNDQTNIPLETDNTAWNGLTTDAYCWYDNNEATYGNTYGVLYNWYVVNTGIICPAGWRVPSDTDWTTLSTYLGGETVAGGKLKTTGTTYWNTPNTGATNEAGFFALPGGYRGANGTFFNVGNNGSWWSSTSVSNFARSSSLAFDSALLSFNNANKRGGSAIRCVKD